MKTLINIKKLLFIILLLINLLIGFGQGSNDTIPFDPELHYGKLKNGFTYYIKKLPKEVTDNSIWVELIGPGSRFEDKDQHGLAHLTEHMLMYSNTTHFKPLQTVFDSWEREGLDYYRHIRTGDFSVRYSWSIPKGSSLHENLLRFREYAWDDQMLQNIQDSTLVHMQGKLTVIQELVAQVNSEDWREWRTKLYRLLGNPSKYYHPVTNDEELKNIQNFKLSSLVQFYKDWYQPDKQALTIIGDVDVEAVEKVVKELFGDLKTPEHIIDKPLEDFLMSIKVKLPKEQRFLHLTTKNKRQQGIKLELYTLRNTLKIKGEVVDQTVGAYRNQLVQELYEQMMFNRMKLLQNNSNFKRKYTPYRIDNILISNIEASKIQVLVNNTEDIPKCFDQLTTELERIKRYGFTAKELEKAKKVVVSRLMEEISKPKTLLSAYRHHFLFGAAAPNPGYREKLLRSLLNTISKEEIHAEAKNWSGLPDQCIVLTTPEFIKKVGLPGMDDFKLWMENVKQKRIGPYKDNDCMEKMDGLQALLSKETLHRLSSKAVPYTIDSIPNMTIIEWQLSNGVNVILKPTKKMEIGKIAIQGIGAENTSTDPKNAVGMHHIINNLFRSAKFSGWDQQGIQEFEKKAGKISIAALEDRGVISATTSTQQLENIFQLIYVYMTGLDMDKEKFEIWKTKGGTEINTFIRRNQNKLKSNFYTHVTNDLLGNNPKENIETLKLDAISLDDIYRVYKTMFGEGDQWTFVITGNFKPDAIKPQVLKYLGNLPIGSNPSISYVGLKHKSFSLKPVSSKDTVIYGGDYAKFSINRIGSYNYDIQEVLKLQILHRLLFRKIWDEGKMNGVYHFLQLRFDFGKDYYRFFLNANAHTKESVEIIKNIVNSSFSDILKNNSFDDKALTDAVTLYKTEFKQMDTGATGYISEKWIKDILVLQSNNESYIEIKKEQLKFLDKLTIEDVHEAAIKYLGKDGKVAIYTQLPYDNKLP